MAFYEFEGKRPSIGKGSYIAPEATIIGDVTLGEGCYVAAGARIMKHVRAENSEDAARAIVPDRAVHHRATGARHDSRTETPGRNAVADRAASAHADALTRIVRGRADTHGAVARR